LAGISGIAFLEILGQTLSDIFTQIFKCISVPIISLSIIVTLSTHVSGSMNKLLKRTFFYTITTTIIAASISCLLYLSISPSNLTSQQFIPSEIANTHQTNYWHYLLSIIPSNFITPFIENQVLSVLLLSALIGVAIRYIEHQDSQKIIIHFFKGMHQLLFIITKWVIAILPIGLFGFITTTVAQIHHGLNLIGMGQYLSVIIFSNLIQGFLILPIWLKSHGISPLKTMRGMLPALSFAFFSKSSAGTLPLTMATAEKNLHIDAKISRFILPLCTTINMNGCAAFIFTTVIFIMQNHGLPISLSTMVLWIFIATIAAIGNAGVPMGCFFLSISLLSSMNVPIHLMAIILPFYSVIDMIETTLNVWSDSCVATVIDHKNKIENLVIDREDQPQVA
jgi:Na+/H+-dicarboxylate symporter